MNKATLIPALIISSFLLAGCNTSPATNNNSSEMNPTESQDVVSSFSLRDLFSKGSNLKCTYSVVDLENKLETKGTMYVSNKRFFQEVEVKMAENDNEAATTRSNMISDGTYMYTWGSDKKMPGMKIKIEDDTTTPVEDEDIDTNSRVNLDEKMDMKCSPWTVDESKFIVPSDVNFTDFSSMMEDANRGRGIPGGMPSIPSEE